ncbi:MAG: phage tail tube protein, partial [Bacteroidales bacterium]|nr:phage tail tube protein [Bacteroidales bacterium]
MAKRALGTTLTVGSTAVGGLTSISGVEISADTIDVTTLDSTDGYREFIGGFIDGGEVSADGYLSDVGTEEATLAELVGADEQSCDITFSNGAKWAFDGVVTGFSTSADLEDAIGFSITIKVSGKPT